MYVFFHVRSFILIIVFTQYLFFLGAYLIGPEYWNFSNLKPRDPVILALCTQEAFQKSLEKAKRRVEREKKAILREEKKAQAASL